jgi:hypothetical protein
MMMLKMNAMNTSIVMALLISITPLLHSQASPLFTWQAGALTLYQKSLYGATLLKKRHRQTGFLYGINAKIFLKQLIGSEITVQYAYGDSKESLNHSSANTLPSSYLRLQGLIHPLYQLKKIDLFSGIGFEYNTLKAHNRHTAHSFLQDHTSSIIYLPLGLEKTFHLQNHLTLTPKIQTNYLLSAQLQHTVNLANLTHAPSLMTVNNELKHGLGFVVSCEFNYAYKNMHIIINPYWHHWTLQTSEPSLITLNVHNSPYTNTLTYGKELRNRVGMSINVSL